MVQKHLKYVSASCSSCFEQSLLLHLSSHGRAWCLFHEVLASNLCASPSEISDRKTFLEISASTARKTAWPCCGGVRGSFKHGITVTLPVGTLFKPSYWIHKCNPCATALVPRGQEKKKSKEKKKKEGKKKECRYRYCIQRCISTGKLMSIKGLQAVC